MDHIDLKRILETHSSVSHGAQQKAWQELRPLLFSTPPQAPNRSGAIWWFYSTAAIASLFIVALSWYFSPNSNHAPTVIEFAVAEQPDIYASPFYSQQGQADVVWISGLEYVPAAMETSFQR